jgi:hypothetical protein
MFIKLLATEQNTCPLHQQQSYPLAQQNTVILETLTVTQEIKKLLAIYGT